MDKKNWDKQDNVVKIIALATLLLLVLSINIMSPNFFAKVWTLATSGNIESTVEFLASYGIWAVAISFLLDVLINAVGFLPSIFLSTANGLIFGLPLGILISWTAESVWVIISFLIMRYFLRAYAEKVIEQSNSLKRLDEMSSDNGLSAMTIARTMPYFPSGILTALGAVSKMSIRDYCIATFIGKFPSTAIEVVLGHDVVNFRQNMDRLAILVSLIAVVYGYMYWHKRKKDKDDEHS
ncbi:MAG: TVP38/TMEM64 family protein [Acholeplasmataceae bacterium]|nr:TVP38/TMEM64 family protein [Acholeplasmataceae bacterium]